MSKLHTGLYALTTLASLVFAWAQPALDHDPVHDVQLAASAVLAEVTGSDAR